MYVNCFMIVSILCAQAASQDVANDGEHTSKPYDRADFVGDQRILSGDGWTMTKYEDKDGYWRARMEAGGKAIKDIGGAGQYEDFLRFLLWPPEDDKHRLLLVLRFAGGAHGPRMMDIIDLQDEFRTVFESGESLNCDDGIEDLDGDGWPEVLGTSSRFDYFDFNFPLLDFHVGSPLPPITLSYDAKRRRYVNANLRFPDRIQRAVERAKNSFFQAWDEGQKIPAEAMLRSDDRPAVAYLLQRVVETCYEKGEETAFGLLEAHADPVLVLFAKHAIQ